MVFRSAKAEERKAQLAALQLVAEQADQYLGVGNDVSADIAEGLKNYDWSGDASTLAPDLEAAIRSARQTQSPSQMMVPIGQGISQGIGEGMGQYSLSGSALLLAANLSASLRAVRNASTMRPIGVMQRRAAMGMGGWVEFSLYATNGS